MSKILKLWMVAGQQTAFEDTFIPFSWILYFIVGRYLAPEIAGPATSQHCEHACCELVDQLSTHATQLYDKA